MFEASDGRKVLLVTEALHLYVSQNLLFDYTRPWGQITTKQFMNGSQLMTIIIIVITHGLILIICFVIDTMGLQLLSLFALLPSHLNRL